MQIVTKVITAKATTITAASTIKSAAAKSLKQTTIMTVIFRYKYNNITKMTT